MIDPPDFPTVSPYLVVPSVEAQVHFLETVFLGELTQKVLDDQQRVRHAEVRVGNSVIMMGRARDESPTMPAMLYVYVDDVDRIWQKALNAGAVSAMEPQDQFYGDRSAMVTDPFNNQWCIATRQENLTSEEIQRRSLEQSS